MKNKKQANLILSSGITNPYKQEFNDLTEKFDLKTEATLKLFNITSKEFNDLIENNIELPENKQSILMHKMTMINHGFSLDITARERVQIIIDNLVTYFELSITSISKITNLEEQEILDFKENKSMSNENDLKIAVNIMMLNSILNQK